MAREEKRRNIQRSTQKRPERENLRHGRGISDTSCNAWGDLAGVSSGSVIGRALRRPQILFPIAAHPFSQNCYHQKGRVSGTSGSWRSGQRIF